MPQARRLATEINPFRIGNAALDEISDQLLQES